MFRVILLTLLPLLLMQVVEALPDPTRPSGYSGGGEAAAKKLQLSSILFSTQRRVAIINGRALTVGESVEGARVVSIESDRVRLQRGNKELLLQPQRVSIRQEK